MAGGRSSGPPVLNLSGRGGTPTQREPYIHWCACTRNGTVLAECGEDRHGGGVLTAARRILKKPSSPGWEWDRPGGGLRAMKFHLHENDEDGRPLIWAVSCVHDEDFSELCARLHLEPVTTVSAECAHATRIPRVHCGSSPRSMRPRMPAARGFSPSLSHHLCRLRLAQAREGLCREVDDDERAAATDRRVAQGRDSRGAGQLCAHAAATHGAGEPSVQARCCKGGASARRQRRRSCMYRVPVPRLGSSRPLTVAGLSLAGQLDGQDRDGFCQGGRAQAGDARQH